MINKEGASIGVIDSTAVMHLAVPTPHMGHTSQRTAPYMESISQKPTSLHYMWNPLQNPTPLPHTGHIKHFQCDICQKGFTSCTAWTRHQMIHAGQTQYKCDVCGKQFNQGNNLARHLRTHTGEKPYRCAICGDTFSQSNSLHRHTRGVHNIDTNTS